jgi:choline dehydrogenase-like flavoprotein
MTEREFDIVIIGAGAAGGVMAQELSPLCRDGARIAVLEWGPRFRPDEFTGRELEMADRLYIDGGGVLTKDGGITIALGRGYGGSTIVYTGTSFIIPQDVLEAWGVRGLEFADIKRRSERYFEENNVHLTPPELINENNRLFRQGCERLGLNVGQFPINVRDCQGAGSCNLGCPHGAKMGTHVVQLPRAERAGVQVITNCRVERIVDRACEAVIENLPFGDPSPWPPGQYRIRAKLIVVCAGAVHTPALLLRSPLPTRLPMLGRNITLHPALILAGQHERSITNYYGHPKSYFCDDFVKSKRFILETCMYFPFTTAKSLTGFGAEHSAMMARMDRLQMVIVLALDEPEPHNRIAVDRSGRPVIDYTIAPRTFEALWDSMIVTARVLFAAGAKRVHAPAGRKFFIEAEEQDRLETLMSRDLLKVGRISLASAHVMGGCAMGDEPSRSVTDPWGQVHGAPWLYVADASLFPRCSEVNPYITIMALADRVAERLRSRAGELLRS